MSWECLKILYRAGRGECENDFCRHVSLVNCCIFNGDLAKLPYELSWLYEGVAE